MCLHFSLLPSVNTSRLPCQEQNVCFSQEWGNKLCTFQSPTWLAYNNFGFYYIIPVPAVLTYPHLNNSADSKKPSAKHTVALKTSFRAVSCYE